MIRCSEMCAESREDPKFKALSLIDEEGGFLTVLEGVTKCAYCDEPAVEVATTPDIVRRLEYLRSQLEAECISYDELHELQSLKVHIDPGDVQLLEAAGVPEFPAEEEGT